MVEDDANSKSDYYDLRWKSINLILRKRKSKIMLAGAANNPDIILMDLGLPDIDGIEVIRKIRTWFVAPIIVISARSDEKTR